MRILKLVLKHRWYDMIESGEKKEEYRELSSYWQKQLLQCRGTLNCGKRKCSSHLDCNNCTEFDVVQFQRAYPKNPPRMAFKCEGINIGSGNPEWGAPEHNVFVIKIGERISLNNIEP